jgi:hypothetical protein
MTASIVHYDTHVTIANFKLYNPRDDVKRPSWFRLEHSLFEHPDFYEFNHTEKMVWIYLLCIASKKNTETFTISWAHAERIGGFKKKDFEGALLKLQQIQVILVHVTDALRARDGHVTSAIATNERTNDTNITDDIPTLKPDDLVSIWNKTCKSLPKVERLTANRRLHAKTRIIEYPDPSYWLDIAQRIETSDFCKGVAQSSRGWVATFDWFLQPDTHVKVLEGKYDDRKTGEQSSLLERLKQIEKGGISA